MVFVASDTAFVRSLRFCASIALISAALRRRSSLACFSSPRFLFLAASLYCFGGDDEEEDEELDFDLFAFFYFLLFFDFFSFLFFFDFFAFFDFLLFFLRWLLSLAESSAFEQAFSD